MERSLFGVRIIVGLMGLLVSATSVCAWDLGGPLYQRGLANSGPASWYGFYLDEDHPGYYGGGHYTQYYGYGRGYGWAFFPDTIPPSPYYGWGRRRYRAYAAPSVIPGLAAEELNGDSGVAFLNMDVPDDAEVWMEGIKTEQSGASRHFVSPPLMRGSSYALEIRIRWDEDGKAQERTREVVLRAGDRVRVKLKRAVEPEMMPAPRPGPTLTPDD